MFTIEDVRAEIESIVNNWGENFTVELSDEDSDDPETSYAQLTLKLDYPFAAPQTQHHLAVRWCPQKDGCPILEYEAAEDSWNEIDDLFVWLYFDLARKTKP